MCDSRLLTPDSRPLANNLSIQKYADHSTAIEFNNFHCRPRPAATQMVPPLPAPQARESRRTFASFFPKGTGKTVEHVWGQTPVFPERFSRHFPLEIGFPRSPSARKLCGH